MNSDFMAGRTPNMAKLVETFILAGDPTQNEVGNFTIAREAAQHGSIDAV
jgi:hypothetical protein